MSNFPGQPHSAGPGRAMQLQTPHEATLRANSAAGPQVVPVVRLPESKLTSRPKHHAPKPAGRSTNTANAYIIPTKDPWRRRRRRAGPAQ